MSENNELSDFSAGNQQNTNNLIGGVNKVGYVDNTDGIILESTRYWVNEIYDVNNISSKNLVSWSSLIHPSVKQPIDKLEFGGLYFIRLKEGVFSIPGLEFNHTDKKGLENFANDVFSETKKNKTSALIYFGICNSDIQEYDLNNLNSHKDLLEVHKFTNNNFENNHHSVWYQDQTKQSTLNKLEFGNSYFLVTNGNEVQIEGAVVLNKDLSELLSIDFCSDEDIPTPTPNNALGCCEETDKRTNLSNGFAKDVNTISLTGSINGTLCWSEIIGEGTPKFFSVSLGNNDFSIGGLGIGTTGNVQDKLFKFHTYEGICYEGKLDIENSEGVNIWYEVGSTPLPTPTPTSHSIQTNLTSTANEGDTKLEIPTEDQDLFEIGYKVVIDKDTEIEEHNEIVGFGSLLLKTPLIYDHQVGASIDLIEKCCDDSSGIQITEQMANASNPTGPSGITISGFETGGVLCVSKLTDVVEAHSCVFVSNDNTFAGLITLSFKPINNNVLYTSTSGKCYEGTLKNTIIEPQILTEQ